MHMYIQTSPSHLHPHQWGDIPVNLDSKLRLHAYVQCISRSAGGQVAYSSSSINSADLCLGKAAINKRLSVATELETYTSQYK